MTKEGSPISTYQLAARLRLPDRIRAPADRTTMIAGAILGAAVVVAVLAPVLAPCDPNAVDPLNVYAGPSAAHWLGTDDTGRDIFSRILFGARPSLLGPALVVLGSTTAGSVLAIISAWSGGWADRVISGALDIVFGFPGLIMAIVAAAIFGAGLMAPVLALSLAYLPFIARVVRSAALRERSLPYIAALELLGVPGWRILARHLLPNLAPIIVVQAAVGYGYALLDIASISFVGLGSQPPGAEWGLMVSEGYSGILAGRAGQVFFAGAAIVIVVIAANLLGSGLSRRLLDGER